MSSITCTFFTSKLTFISDSLIVCFEVVWLFQQQPQCTVFIYQMAPKVNSVSKNSFKIALSRHLQTSNLKIFLRAPLRRALELSMCLRECLLHRTFWVTNLASKPLIFSQ